MSVHTPWVSFEQGSIELSAPLDRNSFAQEFHNQASTITKHDLYALHARQILVDEENYLGLFALDLLLKNKQGQYRKCGITPKANHPLLAFFQVQMFHEDDKLNADSRGWKYLPDRPDLDKILALIHDEGEEVLGLTEEELKKQMQQFLDGIEDYVHQHNQAYPNMPLDVPAQNRIKRDRKDVKGIGKTFDLLTRGYKRQPNKGTYFKYHFDMLRDARACRIKAIDKACNAATFIYRDKTLVSQIIQGLDITKYREWVKNQINKMRDLYIDQTFELSSQFNHSNDNPYPKGFMEVAASIHPNSAKFLNAMREVMDIQLRVYSHNIANEERGHGSPAPTDRPTEYDRVSFTPRVNLIDIQLNRLKEVKRLDGLGERKDPSRGMFGIKFPIKNPFKPLLRTGSKLAPHA